MGAAVGGRYGRRPNTLIQSQEVRRGVFRRMTGDWAVNEADLTEEYLDLAVMQQEGLYDTNIYVVKVSRVRGTSLVELW